MAITRGSATKLRAATIALVCAFALLANAADDKAKKQENVQKMADKVLQDLYKTQPKAKAAVEKAAGYAVFNNMGVKILVAGSGKGSGLAKNNKTQKITYMKMIEVQAGLGFGVKKFNLVWVFENDKVFNKFIESGWEFGGEANAAAKTGTQGGALEGAVPIADGVWLYQMTEKGLALELAVKSTKYYKDSDLN